MEAINIIHTLFSVIALLSGSFIFFSAKGTTLHVRTGWLYVISMLILLFTSFFIFDLFGSFGVYHALSIVSLLTMGLGMYFPLFARSNEGWLIQHYMWMSYSYVGLVMAGGSHLFGLVPDWPAWLRMCLFWGLPYVLGSFWIFRNRKRILQEVMARKGLEVGGEVRYTGDHILQEKATYAIFSCSEIPAVCTNSRQHCHHLITMIKNR